MVLIILVHVTLSYHHYTTKITHHLLPLIIRCRRYSHIFQGRYPMDVFVSCYRHSVHVFVWVSVHFELLIYFANLQFYVVKQILSFSNYLSFIYDLVTQCLVTENPIQSPQQNTPHTYASYHKVGQKWGSVIRSSCLTTDCAYSDVSCRMSALQACSYHRTSEICSKWFRMSQQW